VKYEQAVPGLFTAGTSDEQVRLKEKVSSKRGIEILLIPIFGGRTNDCPYTYGANRKQ
jgi:hypothetical protein